MEQQKKSKIYKILRIVGDIIFVPFIAIIVVSSIIMYRAKMNNEVPSIFGYSAVKILSGSMRPDFEVDDVVIVKIVDTNTLEVGDIIAFYDYMQPGTDTQDLATSTNVPDVLDENTQENLNNFLGGGARNENQKRVANYSRVIFHRIVKIAYPSNPYDPNINKKFFQTQGDAVGSPDSNWIMEDYVVGKYVEVNSFASSILQFCTSVGGLLTLIIVPGVILLAFLSWDLVKDIKKYKQESEDEKKKKTKSDDIFERIEQEEQEKKQEEIEQMKQEMLGDILEKPTKEKQIKKDSKPLPENKGSVKPAKEPNAVKSEPKKEVSVSKKSVGTKPSTTTVNVSPVKPPVAPKIPTKVDKK